MTIATLALRLGVAVAQVLTSLRQLAEAGCCFDRHPQAGVRLLETGLGLWADYLSSISTLQRSITIYGRTTSTQDICRRLVVAQPGDANLVVADEQTAGRGRLGRRWTAPPGTAVTFSQAHADNGQAPTIDRLTFVISVAVASALERFLPVGSPRVKIKWPNDLCIDQRKIAGVLVETTSNRAGLRAAIIGVGINVGLRPDQMPLEIRQKATSLAMCGADVDRLAVLAAVMVAIDQALAHGDEDQLLAQWRARCTTLHQRVRLERDGRVTEGQVVDLDPHLGLILRTSWGAVVHLPAETTTVL